MLRLSVLLLILVVAGCSMLSPKVESQGCPPDADYICIDITKGSQQVQQELEEMLMSQEGFMPTAYEDNGQLSIGYGRNLVTNGVTKEEALYLLRNDVERVTKALTKKYSVFDELTNPRRAVLISMAYNLGMDNLGSFKEMFKALELRDYPLAAREMRMSKWCNQTNTRCTVLSEMMETGRYK